MNLNLKSKIIKCKKKKTGQNLWDLELRGLRHARAQLIQEKKTIN